MPEVIEDNQRAPLVLDIEKIGRDFKEIQVGDTITGFTSMDQFDIAVAVLVNARLGHWSGYNLSTEQKTLSPHSGKIVLPIWGEQHKLPSVALKPKKVKGVEFLGKYVNQSVTLLDESITRDAEGWIDRRQPQSVSLLLDTELSSTGRGIIGRSSKAVEIVESRRTGSYGVTRRVVYTPVEGHTADKAFEFLTAESSSTARLVAVNGLRSVILSGLPGLGKS